ncbi:hypothetical protein CFP56_020275 [Quercus suber]|uniref:Uncharacterized protein n=1 Tax=Quercus suber TaxID=58331 RepID=A0AAW0KGT2_QUESU
MADSVEMGRDLAQVEANLVIVPLIALAVGHSHEHHGPDPLIKERGLTDELGAKAMMFDALEKVKKTQKAPYEE